MHNETRTKIKHIISFLNQNTIYSQNHIKRYYKMDHRTIKKYLYKYCSISKKKNPLGKKRYKIGLKKRYKILYSIKLNQAEKIYIKYCLGKITDERLDLLRKLKELRQKDLDFLGFL